MKPRILIVDDDPDVLGQLEIALSEHDLVLVSRGLHAVIAYLQALDDNQCFDLLILDSGLPHFDGFTIAEYVRKAESTGIVSSRVKIAIFTAYSDIVDKTTLVEKSGIDAYWKKVEDVTRMPELVKELLAQP